MFLQAIIKVQRDNGNRQDRKTARMKYLINEWGIEKFRAEVEKYYGQALEDCTEDDVMVLMITWGGRNKVMASGLWLEHRKWTAV